MCINPGLLPNGQAIGCRKCWQCKQRRIDDWVGRNIAESKTARSCNFVTLTYGRDQYNGEVDHERARLLTYSDVQKFFKRLRFHKFRLRYFVVGEYGTEKGRAHWHVLIYWLSAPPKFRLDVREASPFWDHGFVQWEKLTPESVRYACKYIQKDVGEMARQGMLAMSKKPPLGSEYFEMRAKRFVSEGISPQDLFYGWPDVVDKSGRKVKFALSHNSAVRFVQAYVDEYMRIHGNDHFPHSQMVDDYRDRQTRLDLADEFVMPEVRFSKAEKPFRNPPGGGEVLWSETHNAYYAWCQGDGVLRYWSFDEEGNREWTEVIRGESVSEPNGVRLSASEYMSEYRRRSGSF